MIRNAIASVPVKRIKGAQGWYEKVFERAADSIPMESVAEWRFSEGSWLQVYEAPDRAGGGSVTLSVRDLQAEVARLRKMGLKVEMVTESEPVQVAMLVDPDGNRIAIAETSDTTMAQ